MADVPETITYGRVTWTGFQAVADTSDPGTTPDAVPVSGTVTFSPGAEYRSTLGLTTPDGAMFVRRVTASIIDGVLVDEEGNPGVSLIASSQPDATPGYFPWFASFTLDEIPRMAWPAPVEFSLATGQTVDLTTLAPVPGGDITAQIRAVIATMRSFPGGLAGLDDDGDVIDAEGHKITGGSGGPVDWDDITDKPTWAPVAFSGSYDALTDRPAIPVVPTTLPPTPGSVTAQSMATGLVAMTTAERAALAAAATASSVSTLDAEVQDIASDLSSVASRTTALEGNYSTLAGNMDNLGGRVTDLEAAVAAIPGDVLVLAPGQDVPTGTAPGTVIYVRQS